MVSISRLESGWLSRRWEILIVLSSLLLQMPLAYFLGHYYDERVFMATGYLVSSGIDPYQPIELVNVFAHPLLNGIVPRIGYPPPLPLLLGFIYRISYGMVPNVFFYNFALKIPIIAANIGLAYLVKNILLDLKVANKKAEYAWLFLLFNPFVLITTTAWGQIDTLVALFTVASLYSLIKGKTKQCAVLLAISVAIKPVALPLAPLPLFYSWRLLSRKNLLYSLVFMAVLFILAIAPFFLLGWRIPTAQGEWNGQFNVAGGLTVFNVAEIIQNNPTIPPTLEFLGFLWMPALLISYYFILRNRPLSMDNVVRKAIGLVLIFFLTRSWLSEPNINLVLTLMLIAVGLDKLDKRSLYLSWIVPLIFLVVNTSFPQLFFLVYPSVLTSLAQLDQQFRTVRLIARFAIALTWSIIAWRIVIRMMRGSKEKLQFPETLQV